MKVNIFDIKHFAVHDGPGIRTTVFFKGCPLHCQWCHNPESRSATCQTYIKKQKLNGKEFEREVTIGEIMEIDELNEKLLRDVLFFAESGGGVTFSGGEPLMQANAVQEIAKKLQAKNIHTCLDTTGYAPEAAFKKTIENIDLFLYDIKHLNDEEHLKYTGVSNQLILNNLSFLQKEKKKIIFRFPVIPGVNTNEKHLKDMESFLSKQLSENCCEIDLLPYHKIGSDKYIRFGIMDNKEIFEEPNDAVMHNIKARFEQTGFIVKIGG